MKRSAFTLIELLVVIAIVGILTGFIFVSMNGAVNSAKDAKRKADLANLEKAILAYNAQNNSYPSTDTYPCTIGTGGTCTNLASSLAPYMNTLPIGPNNDRYTYNYSAGNFILSGILSNNNIYSYSSSSGSWTESVSPYPGWSYKKKITVSSGTSLTDYQIKLIVKQTGDAGDSDCDNHCNVDFSDLRFATSSGTALNYWIESYTASTTATVWVKVSAISNPSTDIYMYYGNSSATSASSGDNTFVFFDHFDSGTLDSSKWASSVAITPSASTVFVQANSLISKTYTDGIWESRFKTVGSGQITNVWEEHIMTNSTGVNQSYFEPTNPQAAFYRKVFNYNGSYSAGTLFSWTANTYYIVTFVPLPSAASWYIDRGTNYQVSANYAYTTKTCNFANSGTAGYGFTIDWVFSRKYTTTEPTSAFGTEQNNL